METPEPPTFQQELGGVVMKVMEETARTLMQNEKQRLQQEHDSTIKRINEENMQKLKVLRKKLAEDMDNNLKQIEEEKQKFQADCNEELEIEREEILKQMEKEKTEFQAKCNVEAQIEERRILNEMEQKKAEFQVKCNADQKAEIGEILKRKEEEKAKFQAKCDEERHLENKKILKKKETKIRNYDLKCQKEFEEFLVMRQKKFGAMMDEVYHQDIKYCQREDWNDPGNGCDSSGGINEERSSELVGGNPGLAVEEKENNPEVPASEVPKIECASDGAAAESTDFPVIMNSTGYPAEESAAGTSNREEEPRRTNRVRNPPQKVSSLDFRQFPTPRKRGRKVAKRKRGRPRSLKGLAQNSLTLF